MVGNGAFWIAHIILRSVSGVGQERETDLVQGLVWGWGRDADRGLAPEKVVAVSGSWRPPCYCKRQLASEVPQQAPPCLEESAGYDHNSRDTSKVEQAMLSAPRRRADPALCA
ncbi:hypothetical protein GCM10016234_21750 [Tianweitania populi]|uniref:Uncharacterized protein n=1 Tax=Tianweitania populi TaxID=1607949 RepID=A0A8J3DP19_9HYPH|nr:hypothetical protein GCM10016234_21750 [Tianweitania populi]